MYRFLCAVLFVLNSVIQKKQNRTEPNRTHSLNENVLDTVDLNASCGIFVLVLCMLFSSISLRFYLPFVQYVFYDIFYHTHTHTRNAQHFKESLFRLGKYTLENEHISYE